MRRLIPLLLAALPAFANTITTAEISGFDTTVVTGAATVSYSDPSGDPTIFASALATGSTLGLVRDGFIEITGHGSGNSGGTANGTVGAYHFGCTDSGCSPSNDFNGTWQPFTLGVPFQIDVSAFASSVGWGSGDIQFHFSVFESITPIPGCAARPGEAVTIYDPPDVPEPATMLLCAGGLALLVAGRRIRDSRKP